MTKIIGGKLYDKLNFVIFVRSSENKNVEAPMGSRSTNLHKERNGELIIKDDRWYHAYFIMFIMSPTVKTEYAYIDIFFVVFILGGEWKEFQMIPANILAHFVIDMTVAWHGMACTTLPDPMVPSLTKVHRRFLRGRDPLQSELGSDPS